MIESLTVNVAKFWEKLSYPATQIVIVADYFVAVVSLSVLPQQKVVLQHSAQCQASSATKFIRKGSTRFKGIQSSRHGS